MKNFQYNWKQYKQINRDGEIMRMGSKGFQVSSGENQLFGIDFHDFIQREAGSNSYEIASEFGLTLGDVKKLKKRLERS